MTGSCLLSSPGWTQQSRRHRSGEDVLPNQLSQRPRNQRKWVRTKAPGPVPSDWARFLPAGGCVSGGGAPPGHSVIFCCSRRGGRTKAAVAKDDSEEEDEEGEEQEEEPTPKVGAHLPPETLPWGAHLPPRGESLHHSF